MKEIILTLLKTKFNGIPTNVLERLSTAKAKNISTEEQANSYVEAATLEKIFQYWGDSRATEAATTALKEKTETVQNATVEIAPVNGDISNTAKLIEEQNKQITNLTNLVKGVIENNTTSQKSQIAKDAFANTKLPSKWIERIDLNSEISIADQIESLETEYLEIHQDFINGEIGNGNYSRSIASVEKSEKDWLAEFNEDSESNNVGKIDLGI